MRRRVFQGARSFYGAWGRHKVPRRAVLLPVEVLLVFLWSGGFVRRSAVGSALAARIPLSSSCWRSCGITLVSVVSRQPLGRGRPSVDNKWRETRRARDRHR